MEFLSKAAVIAMHRAVVDLYGGLHGLRDSALLESAIAQPQATFDGQYLHADVWAMAAAYGYHLCRNHAFLDGNKRIAAVAMGAFLDLNGCECAFDEVELYLTMISLAEGQLDKPALARWLQASAKPVR